MRWRANGRDELARCACSAAACRAGAEAVIRIVGHDRDALLAALRHAERSPSPSVAHHDVAALLRAAIRRLEQTSAPTPPERPSKRSRGADPQPAR